jgi:hypothetical protein
VPEINPPGQRRPVGARPHLRGRRQIVLDEWGPWDHQSPLVRAGQREAGARTYDLFGFESPTARVLNGQVEARISSTASGATQRLSISARPGVHPYRIELRSADHRRELAGILVATRWEVTVFPWKIDPREDLDGWRALARGPEALTAHTAHLILPYGWGGPRQMNLSPDITARGPGSDHFGMIARTRIELPAGRWRFTTLSDDGVRVLVDGRPVIENWTWHGPTRDTGLHDQATSGEVEIVVEHFEIDGYAVLEFNIDQFDPSH